MLRRIFTFGFLAVGLFVLYGCGQDTTGIPTGASTGLENISNSALTGDLDAADPAGRPIIDGEAEGRWERIAASLGLSEEQLEAIKQIRETSQQEVKALIQQNKDSGVPRDQIKEAVEELLQKEREQIVALLNEEQGAQFTELIERIRQGRREHTKEKGRPKRHPLLRAINAVHPTDEQLEDIKQILEDQKHQIMALREEFGSDNVDKDAFRAQIKDIEQAALENILGILDEEQGAQLTQLIERIRQGRREHTKEEGRPKRHPLLRAINAVHPTDEQLEDIKQILEDQKHQIMALREEFGSDNVDKDAFRAQIKDIEQAALENILGILDEEQGAQLTQLIERIRQGRREHTKEEGRPKRHPLLRAINAVHPTDEQLEDIKQILEDQKHQIMALREEFGSDDVDKNAFRAQIKEIQQATLQNILDILDEEQGAQLTELFQGPRESRERMRRRHGEHMGDLVQGHRTAGSTLSR